MKIAFVLTLIGLATPEAFAVKGVRGKAVDSHHRTLKGDDEDDEDGGIPGLPDVEDICFSAVATTEVLGKGPVAMKDLNVGDMILTANGNYEPVYAFGHKLEDHVTPFLQIATNEPGQALEITRQHMLYLHGKPNPVRASSIKVGDVLNGRDNRPATVTNIKAIERPGLYAPLTKSGNLVVDGIQASCYISVQLNTEEFMEFNNGISTGISQQDFVHLMMSPFRLLAMGVSPKLFASNDNAEGMPAMLQFAKYAWLVHEQNIFVQLILLTLALAITGVCMMMELAFGAAYAPLAMLAIGTGAVWMNKNGYFNGAKAKTA